MAILQVCGKGKLLLFVEFRPDICMDATITVAACLVDAPLNASKRQQSCRPTESEANYCRSIRAHLLSPCSAASSLLPSGMVRSCPCPCPSVFRWHIVFMPKRLPAAFSCAVGLRWVCRWAMVLPWSCWIFHRLFRTKFLLPLAFIVG